MPTSLGPAEILVILVVALVVLGPKRLPEAGRQIGRFVSEVRHWSSAVQAEIRDVIDLEGEPQPPPPAPPVPAAPVQQPQIPTPQDLSTPAAAPAPAPKSAAAEWGLPDPTPQTPEGAEAPAAPATPVTPAAPPVPPAQSTQPPTTTPGLPPEWATPSTSNGDS